MKDRALKILLLLIIILPMWMTLMAVAGEPSSSLEALRTQLNTELLKAQDTRIQILEIKETPEAIALADGLFDLDTSTLKPRGYSKLGILVRDTEGRVLKRYTLDVQAMIEKRVAVLNRSIKSGEVLSEADYQWEYRDARQLRATSVLNEAPQGYIVKGTLRAGEILDLQRLEAPAVVQKGDRVAVKVVGSGITIVGTGMALEPGRIGQSIRIVNLDSKKEIFGTVTGAQMAEVKL